MLIVEQKIYHTFCVIFVIQFTNKYDKFMRLETGVQWRQCQHKCVSVSQE